MNISIFITSILLFLGTQTGFTQKNTYVGIEAALNHDVYDQLDKGNLLKKAALISGYYGLNIRQELNNAVFIEAGILRKHYYEGFGTNIFSGYSETNAINAWLIPLRLGSKINLKNHQLFLIPVIGYARAVNSDYGYGDGGIGGFQSNLTDTVHFSVSSNLNLRRSFPLLQTGLSIECYFLKKALLSFSANYYTGFTNVIEQDIIYTHNSNTYTASGLSKGELMSFGVAAKYPIGGIWNKRKE
jgi:hypothetical protein